MKSYKIKDGINLFEILPQFGYEYIGNFNRGDNWVKIVDNIDSKEPKNGIVINGDWNSRGISFKHPFRGTTDNLDILNYIPDLVEANLLEEREAE